ncbi:phosphate ABC transporter substrate-binding protein PstS [Streptomyces sp. GC420]|uniref:phosphate ABC transporter substrate-binding protein PstS n=1 Tax=Streptomyces sp. GC420 TaxID=2697568 RepID=UPI0028BDED48|nr:phosphate ABC transporter substrate-binding protein PstS [Streptomyces sp. GC420]
MQRTSPACAGRRTGAFAAAIAAAAVLLLPACDSAGPERDGGQPSVPPAAADIGCAGNGKLLASGSTAQQNALEYWVEEYERACPGVQISYRPLGSGAGVAQFLRGATVFGGTDSALKPGEVELSKEVCPGGRAIDLPMVGGPIAIGYQLEGVDDLVLDAPAIAGIFDARITTWDHPDIRRLNPGTELPSVPVLPVHRSDESGTTQNLNAYLSGAVPRQWPYPKEKAWQGRGGQSADGSDGVAAAVLASNGAIGYFELSFAEAGHIDTVRIDTGASEPVGPSAENATAGLAAAEVTGTGNDMTMRFDYGTSEAGAYPIVLVTYEVVCDTGNQKQTLPALKSLLAYMAGEEGQRALPELHYAPLPGNVVEQVREVIATLS